MNTQEFEIIENYFSGKLGETEKQSFQQKLESDPAFAERVNKYSLAKRIVWEVARSEMKKNLEYLHKSLSKTGKLNAIGYNPIRLAAAILILLGLAGAFYFSFLKVKSSDKLFAEYFEPYPDVISNRGENTTLDPLVSEAIASYKKRDFAGAWVKFNEWSNKDQSPDDFITLYRGISGLKSGHESEATELFSKIRDGNSKTLYEQSTWFLALSWLKTGDKEKALPLLKELSDKNLFNSGKAKLLLKEAGN